MSVKTKDYKNEYIKILKELKFYNKKYEKEHFKASKYGNAIDALKDFSEELTNSSQIKNIPNIGKAMTDKLDELIKTNKVKNLESLREKYPQGAEEYKKEDHFPCVGDIHFMCGQAAKFSGHNFQATPKVGDIFLFPSWLSHGVYPFRTPNQERRSISFNIDLKRKP